MKSMLIAVAVGAAATSAAPALAQPLTGTAYVDIQAREGRLAERIDQGLSDGVLTLAQTQALKDDLARVVSLDRYYRLDGLTLSERIDLISQLSGIEGSLGYSMTDTVYTREYGAGSAPEGEVASIPVFRGCERC